MKTIIDMGQNFNIVVSLIVKLGPIIEENVFKSTNIISKEIK